MILVVLKINVWLCMYTHICIYIYAHICYIHTSTCAYKVCFLSAYKKDFEYNTTNSHRECRDKILSQEGILISFSFDAHMTVHITSLTFLSLYPGNMLGKRDLLFNVPAVKCQVHSNLMQHLNFVQDPPSVSYFHMLIRICMLTGSICPMSMHRLAYFLYLCHGR